MRLGYCGNIEDAGKARDAGFDFLEVNAQKVLRGLEDDATWTPPAPGSCALPIEAANALLPQTLPVIGAKRDPAALKTYLQRVAHRAQIVGIRRIVFGAGAARRRPDDLDLHTATEHLAEFCQLAGDALQPHGVTLVIEHLNAKETNTLNKLSQAKSLCERVDHPAVALLVDTYHYGLEHETERAVLDLGDELRHVHLAEPHGRGQPGVAPEHPFDFENFFCLLRKIGYDDRISVEANWTAPLDQAGPACVQLLRQAWEESGRSE